MSNDDKFFPFDETTEQVLLAFLRDNHVATNCAVDLPEIIAQGADTTHPKIRYPPSGVIPFEGISLLCAPLCYVYPDVVDVYFVWRDMYERCV